MNMKEIGNELLTQDNRCTSHPVFNVIERAPGGALERVDSCFTNKGAEAYIRRHRHNLNKPYIYISSGWKNAEWIAIREYLMELAK